MIEGARPEIQKVVKDLSTLFQKPEKIVIRELFAMATSVEVKGDYLPKKGWEVSEVIFWWVNEELRYTVTVMLTDKITVFLIEDEEDISLDDNICEMSFDTSKDLLNEVIKAFKEYF